MLVLDDIAEKDRLIAIDCETTGYPMLTPEEIAKRPKGLKIPGIIIEIGCVELIRGSDGWVRGQTWETKVNPDGPLQKQAREVHGIHPNELKNAPRWADVEQQFLDLVGDDILVAHAALNEMDFLNYELARSGRMGWNEWMFGEQDFVCTQILSRQFFPRAAQSLDALCDRLWIDRKDRFAHHGALLDADLTAEAFMEMASGNVNEQNRSRSFG
jgi:DNA polymerase-3 subunit epsilon